MSLIAMTSPHHIYQPGLMPIAPDTTDKVITGKTPMGSEEYGNEQVLNADASANRSF